MKIRDSGFSHADRSNFQHKNIKNENSNDNSKFYEKHTTTKEKDSLDEAFESFNKDGGPTTQPFQSLLFHIPLTTYHDWVHEGVMVRTSHVGGYRIKADINVKEIDRDFTLHPLSII